jgi:SlyX protein
MRMLCRAWRFPGGPGVLVVHGWASYAERMVRTHDEEFAQQFLSRLTDLEVLFTHLQRTVHDLDQVVIRHERRLDSLEQALQHLTRHMDGLSNSPEEPISLEDERPPHY